MKWSIKIKQALVPVAITALLICGLVATAGASGGLTGDCVDCHTMHNSEQGVAVAQLGTNGTITQTPLPNLLRMDCIACHAQDANGADKIVDMGGGSSIPQVWHSDATGDLAGGNFRYIADGGNRKGHNVVDLVAADSENIFPPGHKHKDDEIGSGGFDVESFTCAGSMGCHGYRGQVLSSSTLFCDPFSNEKYINGNPTGLQCTVDEINSQGTTNTFRTGLAALSGEDGNGVTVPFELRRGAHHSNFDGLKNNGLDPNYYESPLAHSYRFILSLRGYGNEVDRWENKDQNSHNEYAGGYANNPLGDVIKSTDFGTTPTCARCHFNGIASTQSAIYTPGQTITGFCITCHGKFHSSGVTNGTSSAFLRHPSDWIIPESGEYAAYDTYNITAPVARPNTAFTAGMNPSSTVTGGQDLVMCLSCHMAHASPYDGMLRFDYSDQSAGNATTGLGQGCLACHTTKGILPENR